MKESGFDPARFYQSKRKTDPLTLNINSTSLKRAFFAHTGITLPLTEKGNHSFSAEAFEEIDHPVARLYLGYDAARARGIALKQRRKHIWPKSGRIHPTFHTLGANSGRIISSDPNMQNVPREAEARAMFQARPGFVFVHGDLSKIELRCMAHFSNDERLIEIFNGDPKDPANDVYAVIGSQITGVPVADIARNHDLEGYFIGKRTVLSYPYGMQPPEFVARNRKPDGSRFTLDEAIEFRRAFFATFPGLAAWIEEAWEMVRMGDVNEGRTSWGRRRLICPLIPGTRNNLAWRTFQSQINFKVQGACADGLKRSIVDNLMNRAWQLGTLDPHPIGCLYVAKETSEKPGFPDATNAIAHQSAL